MRSVWVREICTTALAVAVAAGGYWALRRLLPKSRQPLPGAVWTARALVGVGERVEVAGSKFPAGQVSFLIFSDPTCPFSRQSRSAHRRIVEKAAAAGIPAWLAAPDPGASRRLASELGIENARALSWSEISLRPGIVPSIALVDGTGRVARVWRGMLDPSEETLLLEALAAAGGPIIRALPPARRGQDFLSHADLREMASQREILFLVTAERGEEVHLPSGVNARLIHIPLSELGMRARRELPAGSPVVIDCRILGQEPCRIVADLLREKGLVAKMYLD